MQRNFGWYLMKLDRVAAWTLLATMVLYFISGYGMTKGIISYQLAINIHNNWLPLVLLSAFSFHACYAISLAFKRWRIWNSVTKFCLLSFFGLFFIGLLYVNSYYQKKYTITNSVNQNVTSTNSSTGTSSSAGSSSGSNTTAKTFTAAELAKYDGTNANPAYVAISGKVYDVSGIFVNGNHHGCNPGQDVTTAFYQIHNDSFLSGLTIVGTYSG